MPYSNIQGSKLYYRDIGVGFPIVFGHSFICDRKMWDPQIELLSQHYRCIVPDLFGHGQSGPLPENCNNFSELGSLHAQFVDNLELDEFGLVGLSIGGMWGAHLCLQKPDRVKFFACMASFLGEEPPEKKKLFQALLQKIIQSKFFTQELLDQLLPFFFSPNTSLLKPYIIEKLSEALKHKTEEEVQNLLPLAALIINREDQLDLLRDLKQPTLFIVGEDDISRPPHESKKMMELVRHSTCETVARAGHLVNLEQPEVVNLYLKDFIEKQLKLSEQVA